MRYKLINSIFVCAQLHYIYNPDFVECAYLFCTQITLSSFLLLKITPYSFHE